MHIRNMIRDRHGQNHEKRLPEFAAFLEETISNQVIIQRRGAVVECRIPRVQPPRRPSANHVALKLALLFILCSPSGGQCDAE